MRTVVLSDEEIAAIIAAREFCRSRHMRGHPSLDTLADRIQPPYRVPVAVPGVVPCGRAGCSDFANWVIYNRTGARRVRLYACDTHASGYPDENAANNAKVSA